MYPPDAHPSILRSTTSLNSIDSKDSAHADTLGVPLSVHIPVLAADELRVRAPFDINHRPQNSSDLKEMLPVETEDTASSFDSSSSSSSSVIDSFDEELSPASSHEILPRILSDLAALSTIEGSDVSSRLIEEAKYEDESFDLRDWWLEGRPHSHYPETYGLPWHFSFVDDGSIGGMSAPLLKWIHQVERKNWKALAAEGVGLVVNATEAAIKSCPLGSTVCTGCGFVEEHVDFDVFDDLEVSDGVRVLFLPVPDGSVPRFRQIRAFLKHANHTIDVLHKKVVIHCQAGIGRTGTLLAIYLMERYNISAAEAISRLRFYRPQSLQFHRSDWQSFPFRKDPDSEIYSRNLLQECFIQRYWDLVINKRQTKSENQISESSEVSQRNPVIKVDLSDSVEKITPGSLECVEMEKIFPVPLGSICTDPSSLKSLVFLLEEHLSKALPLEDLEYSDDMEIDDSSLLSDPHDSDSTMCYVCQKISVVGPYMACKKTH
ncbi:cell division control protein 14 [Nowakowskiella sp. JEL0078]|nr:cell division control protein 14 [Nowakowskiella sp. JEL0078]